MEELLSNKHMLLAIGTLIFVGSIMLGIDFLNTASTEKDTIIEHKKYEYKMYVKSTEIFRFNFEAAYDECEDSNGKKYACGNYSDKILTSQLIDSENSLFNNINFNNKSIIDAISTIIDISLKNNYSSDSIKIISNYEFNYKDITDELKKKFNLDDNFKVIGITRNTLDDKAIIEELSDDTLAKLHKIYFDSFGGTPVSEQEIVEGELLIEPVVPAKEGFEFIEWQVNGVKYDFNVPVTSDLMLIACWKEIINEEPTTVATTNAVPDKNVDSTIQTTTTTTTTVKKSPSKILSSLNKINLNDNFLVYNEIRGSTCGYYYFSKGIDEGGEIIYDELAETSVINEIEKTKTNLPMGIKDFSYSFEDHKLRITYTVLLISKKYNNTTLYKSWQKHINQISSIWNTATYTGAGMCNSKRGNQVILNEDLCRDYNLNCSRW